MTISGNGIAPAVSEYGSVPGSIEWDGRDLRGGRAAAGTYIIRLEGSGSNVMRKVVLLH